MQGVQDDDPYTDDVNVKLGGYDLNLVGTWLDHSRAVDEWIKCFDRINITVQKNGIGYGDYHASVNDDTFEMAISSYAPPFTEGPYKIFAIYTDHPSTGESSIYYNNSNWINTEYEIYLSQFETADNSADREYYASLLQEILATEIPNIPTHMKTSLTIYNTKYWNGWATNDNLFDVPSSSEQGYCNYIALRVRQILNLKRATTVTNGIWQDIFENGNLVNCIDEEQRKRFTIDCTISDPVSIKLTARMGVLSEIPIPETLAVLSIFEIEISDINKMDQMTGNFKAHTEVDQNYLYQILTWDGEELIKVSEKSLNSVDNTISVQNLDPNLIYILGEIVPEGESNDIAFDIPGYPTAFFISIIGLSSLLLIKKKSE